MIKGLQGNLPTVSPQSATMVGPGMDPLTDRTILSIPSGAAVVFVISNQYCENCESKNLATRTEQAFQSEVYIPLW